jgi:hypothetical protein
LDDYLEEYLRLAKKEGAPVSLKVTHMSTDEMWLRDPEELHKDELVVYEELFKYACEDIRRMKVKVPIIAEGAGFLPRLMKKNRTEKDSYICIVPTKEFQYSKYRERDWVPTILKGCSDKDQAFLNWMERDALFAKTVRGEAEELGYKNILVDGNVSIAENIKIVKNTFGLQ